MYNCRKYIIAISLFVICFNIQVKADDTLTSTIVETASLKLFNDKSWKELIIYSDNAIGKGFDYYYLRIRAGIACYETKKYRKAETHFRKALSFNSGDEEATTYLYLCLLYNEKYEQARWTSKSFSAEQKTKLEIKKPAPLTFINLEGALKTSSVPQTFGNAQFYQLGIEHYLANRVSLFHSFSYFSQKAFGSSPYKDTIQRDSMGFGNVHYKITDSLNSFKRAITHTQQFHYYLKATVPFKNNFSLSASGQLIYNKDSYTATDTISQHPGPPGPQGQPPPKPRKRIIAIPDSAATQLNFVFSAIVVKSTTHFDYSIGTALSKYDKVTEYQLSGGLKYYPFSNNRFAIGCIGYAHAQNGSSGYFFAYSPSISFVPVKKLTISADFMQNQRENIVEYLGYYVNSPQYFTHFRTSVTIQYALSKRMSVYANYGYEQKDAIAPVDKPASNFHFTNNLFLVGIAIIP